MSNQGHATDIGLTARLGTVALDFLDKILALDDFTEDNLDAIVSKVAGPRGTTHVFPVQPRCHNSCDEELRAVGVGACASISQGSMPPRFTDQR